jgi:hypothetical protein
LLKKTRIIDAVLAESFEVPKFSKTAFSANHRVMAAIICILRVEGRKGKG